MVLDGSEILADKKITIKGQELMLWYIKWPLKSFEERKKEMSGFMKKSKL